MLRVVRVSPPIQAEGFWPALGLRLLPVWGFLLYLFSRLLNPVDRLLRRFGRSASALKIRVFRARRNVAGRLTGETKPAAETAAA